LMGNLLFEIDRKLSYELHQEAAKAAPDNADVTWEWALEQHRAGEYAAALDSYKQCTKRLQKPATAYAMQADCLLRLNRVDEAIEAWLLSEKSSGSIAQMESIVCAVHRDTAPYAERE